MTVNRVAYLTDVEGRWSKLEGFAAGNPVVTLDGGELRVAPGATFVFGGDAVDRGPAGRRILAALLGVARRQPDQVVLLAGNRDINKIRLARELCGHPPRSAPELHGPALLRWILEHTMGAPEAFEHRRAELSDAGEEAADQAVFDSFLADSEPGGIWRDYLPHCRLAYRAGETLFVHGGVTEEGFGVTPGAPDRTEDVDVWLGALNAFYARQVGAYLAGEMLPAGRPGWSDLLAYQAPLRGTRMNQSSVVYARPTDDVGNPVLPAAVVVRALRGAGVRRVVVGHTPSGDCPAVLRDGSGFEIVLADNSYGRLEPGSQVHLAGPELRVVGETLLDGGEHLPVDFALDIDDLVSPIGRPHATGRLVKARLARGDLLLFRALPGHRVEQIASRD